MVNKEFNTENEKNLQENFTWARSQVFSEYNEVLGYYQALSCLDYVRGKSLLDMPCGDGTITTLLAPAFEIIVGVDASSSHLSIARQILPNVQFYNSLIEDYEPSQQFDTITMLNILEHVVDPVHVLQKASSMLSSKGVLIVHVPNANAVNRRIAVLMGTLTHCEELSPFDINVAGHRRSYTLSTLCQDIKNAGLNIYDTGGVFYKSLSTPQMNWLLESGPWQEGGFGWGRVGNEEKDWKVEFCRASYEFGKQHPEDCNIVYACITK